MALLNKHIILVEIAWDNGVEGYSFERYRNFSMEYLDLLVSISSIDRSADFLGQLQFPSVTLQLADRGLHFAKKRAVTPHRGREVTIKILPPLSGLSSAIVVFKGKISRASLRNGILTLDVTGANFEQLLDSSVAESLPIISKGLFPAFPGLPEESSEVATVPLIYGRVHSHGEDQRDTANRGAVRGYLIDEDGLGNEFWQNMPSDAAAWQSICWSDSLGIFVAVGSSSKVMTSPDGINWTLRTPSISRSFAAVAWSEDLGLFAALPTSGGGASLMTSPDGINWTTRTSSADLNWSDIVWAPELGLFVAVQNSNTDDAMTSPDGINWTGRDLPEAAVWEGITWSPELGLLVAVGHSGTGGHIATSVDGISWASRFSPGLAEWYAVAWVPELSIFVAGGEPADDLDGAMFSADGLNWFLTLVPYFGTDVVRITGLSWSPEFGLLAAVATGGGDGTVLTTDNGVDWTYSDISPGSTYRRLAWSPANKRWAAPASNSTGVVAVNPDDLDQKFRYAIAVGPTSGDKYNLGYAEFVDNYGVRVPVKKVLQTETFGDHTISIISFASDQRDPNRPDEPEITLFESGIRTGGDGTDAILNPVTAKQEFMLGYGGFTSGDLFTASWTQAEADAVTQHLADDISDGVAPASLGALIVDSSASRKSEIEKFDRSFGLITFVNRSGLIGTLVSSISDDPASTLSVDDERHVLQGTLGIDDAQQVATSLHLPFASDYRGQLTRIPPNYQIPGALTALSLTGTGNELVYPIELPHCRRIGTVVNVARAYAEYLHPKSEWLSFELPIRFFNQLEIGDHIDLTHWRGISETGGYTEAVMRVLGVSVMFDPSRPRLNVRAFRRFPGLSVHDNFDRTPSGNALGLSWSEQEGNPTALRLADVTEFDEGAAANLTYCTAVSATGKGFAIWDEDTQENQIASIQILRVSPGSSANFGVGVRMSGTYSAFTGYVALFQEVAPEEFWIRLYRYNGENLSSSSGTLLSAYPLTNIELPVSTWRAQGDILELRVEGSQLQVWYFSDMAANNIGKIIDIGDTSITEGQLGIINRSAGTGFSDDFSVGEFNNIDDQLSSDGSFIWQAIDGGSGAGAILRTNTNDHCQAVLGFNERLAYRAEFDMPSNDYWVESEINIGADDDIKLGLMVRKDSSATLTYYDCCVRADTNVLRIRKRVAGTFTTLVNISYTFDLDTWYRIRFEVQGNTLRAYVDGVQVGTDLTDSSIPTGTRTGLVGETDSIITNTGNFDDFRVSSLTEIEVGDSYITNFYGRAFGQGAAVEEPEPEPPGSGAGDEIFDEWFEYVQRMVRAGMSE